VRVIVERGSFSPLAVCPVVISLRKKAVVGEAFAAFEHSTRIIVLVYCLVFNSWTGVLTSGGSAGPPWGAGGVSTKRRTHQIHVENIKTFNISFGIIHASVH
jgi:hypothetical protein